MKAAVAVILAALCAGCASQPKEARVQWSAPPEAAKPKAPALIIESKTPEIPQWAAVYEEQGISGVEALADYAGMYLFIGANAGRNFGALSQWLEGFTVSHDFAPLAASRVQARFTRESATFPDQDFGAFFEGAVKGAADAAYTGAVKEADFWVKKRYFKEDGATVDREAYEFLILVKIDKEALRSQLDAILNAVPVRGAKDQTASANRLKASFYDNF
ncbi:MAG: hypothetical protein LBD13_05070 [Spirochaetaceae bacterium]|jgi:hypothetical protein|nr:hypothetical protein [Spirochaetaceae bacterium]